MGRIDGSRCTDVFGAPRGVFEREFHYDHRTDGCFELCMEGCSLEHGLLVLALRRHPPQRLQLRKAMCSAPIKLWPEADEIRRRPEFFEMTPARSVDAESVC